jgi:DNA invertase Pin-like site-specific DNA recombinase
MSEQKRVLAGIRLSRDQDASTSVERQRDQASMWARMTGAEVVAEAVDTDVSGNVPAMEREKLGPYFRAPLLDTWDVLVVAKLDRLTRNVSDFCALITWAEEHRKTIVSIAESFDLSTPAGRMVAKIMATFAEFERERIGERMRESMAKLATLGRWRGGKAPYPYVGVKASGDGWTLVQDPERAAVANGMVDDAIAGQSNGKIADRLNAEKIPTARGGYEWTPENVRVMLHNPALAGYSVAHGEIVRDADGAEVMVTAEPLLSRERWNELQAAMTSRGQHHRERVGGHQLLRVAYCRNCSPERGKHSHGPQERCISKTCRVPLYGALRQGRTRKDLYRCGRCGYATGMEELEIVLERFVLGRIGGKPMPKLVTIPGEDHTAELHTVEARIAEIEALVDSGSLPVASAARMLASAETERERLAALPQREARVEYVATSQTVSEHWDTLTHEQRGQFYRDWEFTCFADTKGVAFRMPWDALGSDSDQAARIAKAFGMAP